MRKYLELFLALMIILAAVLALSTQAHVFPLQDYVQYWSAGTLNLHQGNPYDPSQMFEVEKALGYQYPDALLMYNPPWLLSIAMLMALVPYAISRAAFFLASLLILLFGAHLGWELYNGNKRFRWLPWMVILTFYGVLHLLNGGQITSFVILGIGLFLFFIYRDQQFWAGFFSPLLLIKPHLIYLFLAAIIFWMLRYRRWKVLAGLVSGLFVLSAIPLLANSQVFNQYLNFIANSPIQIWATATAAAFLRGLFGADLFWVQFVPSALGLVWFLWYWFRQEKRWDWSEQAPLLLLVSVATAAYGWIFDHPIFYLAILQVLALAVNRWPWKGYQWLAILAYLAIDIYVTFVDKPQHELWWVGTTLLLIYLFLMYSLKQNPGKAQAG